MRSKCNKCGRIGYNAFANPFDWAECIGRHHSPRSDNEYYWKCPYCGEIAICLILRRNQTDKKTDEGFGVKSRNHFLYIRIQ